MSLLVHTPWENGKLVKEVAREIETELGVDHFTIFLGGEGLGIGRFC